MANRPQKRPEHWPNSFVLRGVALRTSAPRRPHQSRSFPMRKSRFVIVSVVATALVALPVAFALGARRAGPTEMDLALINGIMQLVEQDYVHSVDTHNLTKDALKG